MKQGDKVAIVCCSNGQKKTYKEKLELLTETLQETGLIPVYGKYIYEKDDVFGASAMKRAEELMGFYRNEEIKAIFDISGGDVDIHIIQDFPVGSIGDSDVFDVQGAVAIADKAQPELLHQLGIKGAHLFRGDVQLAV